LTYLFYILATVLIWFSYKSFRGGIEYLRYFRQEIGKPRPEYTPFVSIFAPCRGVDQEMLENIDAVLAQDYPEFEVIFILDDDGDHASEIIESAWREARRQVKLIVAPKATDSSQKVTNLREGVLYAEPHSEIFVFVDSDARPSRDWLRYLVAPLADERVGAATGYRWFISKRMTLASEMRSMWNASIASALGPNRRSNFCWGGSTAIRRDVFERLGIRDRWSGTLSDDFTVTKAMNEAGLDIVFVPQALIASVEDCSTSELFEFTTRQMKITRVYSAKLWAMSFFGSGLFNVVMLAAVLILILSTHNDLNVIVALVTLVSVTFFSVGKSWLRLNAVRLALPKYERELQRQLFPQLTLWILTPALFFWNCVAAWISRRMTWRGTRYEMVSHRKTLILK
jgi:cellulose synthase/poly-beta-1,6-N-acetylglucosamine synthase-like glycosyltransferase